MGELFDSMRRIGFMSLLSSVIAFFGAIHLWFVLDVSGPSMRLSVGVLVLSGVGFLIFGISILQENKRRRREFEESSD